MSTKENTPSDPEKTTSETPVSEKNTTEVTDATETKKKREGDQSSGAHAG